MKKVGRLSPALPGPALLLLVAFGCNVMITRFGQGAQRGAMTMETPMKVTKKTRSLVVMMVQAGPRVTVAAGQRRTRRSSHEVLVSVRAVCSACCTARRSRSLPRRNSSSVSGQETATHTLPRGCCNLNRSTGSY